MGLYKTEGVVLKSIDFGEADKIVTFYTSQQGKVRAVAKGGRRLKSGFGASLELLTYNDLTFYKSENRDLATLSQCKIQESFSPLREDLEKIAYAFYLAELVSEMAQEANLPLFNLLLKTLYLFREGYDKKILIQAFALQMLHLVGYKPSLETCLICKEKIKEQKDLKFSIFRGGIICSKCGGGKGRAISPPAVGIMRQFLKMEIEKIGRLKVPENIFQEIKGILNIYIHYHLEKRLKSLNFLELVEGK